MYCFKSRVRYSETDKNGFLTLQGILDYFQDASTFHSEDLGVGIEYLAKHNMLWVLSSWQIVVERYPKMGEEIEIVTFPYGFKGFFGLRNFYISDKEGQKIAYANSVWTLMDMSANRPSRPLTEMIEKYELEEKLQMEYAPRKIEMEGSGERQETIVVKTHHLDMNNHVNNGQYIGIALDALQREIPVKQMRAEYKKSAVLHDEMIPYIVTNSDTIVVKLCDKNNEPFAIVELAQ